MDLQIQKLSALVLLFVSPLTITIIGNNLGAGIRFPLVLYQETVYGTSLIPVWREIDYVAAGLIGGRSACAILLWTLGTLLLLAAVAYLIIRRYEGHRHTVALLLAGAGVAYLASIIAQYGPLFHGPAGFCIPAGVPLIFGVAWWVYHAGEEDESNGVDDLQEPESDEVPSGDSR